MTFALLDKSSCLTIISNITIKKHIRKGTSLMKFKEDNGAKMFMLQEETVKHSTELVYKNKGRIK